MSGWGDHTEQELWWTAVIASPKFKKGLSLAEDSVLPTDAVVAIQLLSDSLQPYGLQHTRLLCPLLSPSICSHLCPLSQ